MFEGDLVARLMEQMRATVRCDSVPSNDYVHVRRAANPGRSRLSGGPTNYGSTTMPA
jgi:hypothetical protein